MFCKFLCFKNIKGYEAILFVNPRLVPGLEQPDYKEFTEDISLLWLIPLTSQEYEFSMSEGSQTLIERAADLKNIHVFDGKPKFIV